jgi:hypothetical protein
MEKKLITRYQLVKVEQTLSEDCDDTILQNIQATVPGKNEFDTQEEALQHAMNSEEWFQTIFTILPLYYISEKRN